MEGPSGSSDSPANHVTADGVLEAGTAGEWGRLEFENGTVVPLNIPVGARYMIGHTQAKGFDSACDYEAVDSKKRFERINGNICFVFNSSYDLLLLSRILTSTKRRAPASAENIVKYAARRGVLFCRYVRVVIRAIKCILSCHSIGWITEHSLAQFAMYFSMPVCKALTARACGCEFQDTSTGGT